MISQLLKDGARSTDAKSNYMHPYTAKLYALFIELEEQAGAEFYDLFKERKLSKGTYLLNEGEVSTKCFYIKDGIAHSFQRRGERDMTMFFTFSNEFIDSYQSSVLKIPSSVSIQLLTDATVFEFDWSLLNRFKPQYPVIWKIEELIIVCLLSAFETRLVDMQEKTATERYEAILLQQPQLVKSVSLAHIANYIGCTAECISRIRAKISCRANHVLHFR